ncbi:hypothetical protein D3C87_1512720 [compost metagenome]
MSVAVTRSPTKLTISGVRDGSPAFDRSAVLKMTITNAINCSDRMILLVAATARAVFLTVQAVSTAPVIDTPLAADENMDPRLFTSGVESRFFCDSAAAANFFSSSVCGSLSPCARLTPVFLVDSLTVLSIDSLNSSGVEPVSRGPFPLVSRVATLSDIEAARGLYAATSAFRT